MDAVGGHSDDTERRLAAIAASQHGLFTRGQARNLGLSNAQLRSRVSVGRWDAPFPGVFRIAGAAVGQRQLMVAAVLWGGRRAVLSHRAAGVWWGLDAIRADELEITVEVPRQLRHPNVRVHRTRALAAVDRAVHDGVRVTSVARTLIDLAAVVLPTRLELAVEDALRRRLVDLETMNARLDALSASGRKGCAALRSLLDERGGVAIAESAPEVVLARVLVRAGLPKPERQYAVPTSDFVAHLDLAYPIVKVGIEYDGAKWHSGRVAQARDRRRDHALAAVGWRVLRVTGAELRDGAPSVIVAIRAALADSVSSECTPRALS